MEKVEKLVNIPADALLDSGLWRKWCDEPRLDCMVTAREVDSEDGEEVVGYVLRISTDAQNGNDGEHTVLCDLDITEEQHRKLFGQIESLKDMAEEEVA